MVKKLPPDDLPLVTAVVTTYNRFIEAKRAIISATNQTYEKCELIVIEDGSRSGIQEWISRLNISDIRYERIPENRGLSSARNEGLQLARGKYITFLDDDDEWRPNRVEVLVAKAEALCENEKNRFGVIHSSLETRFPNSSRAPKIQKAANAGFLKSAILREGVQTISSSPMFLTEALKRVGGFDEALTSGVDHDMWMSLAVGGYWCVAVEDSLVISYSRVNRFTMMNNATERIEGVDKFVRKWSPVFMDWYGERDGIRYAEKYFVNVIGYLLSFKVAERNFEGISDCFSAIMKCRNSRSHSCIVILKAFIRGLLKRVD